MLIADCFSAAFEVARKECQEWLFAEDGTIFNEAELKDVAVEYDRVTPLAEDEFLVITKDGSIGLLKARVQEPIWLFVSPEFAAANILSEQDRVDLGLIAANKSPKFCRYCGQPLNGGKFCGGCGKKVE